MKFVDDFFAAATLTLSPLPHRTDIEGDEYRRIVEGWTRDVEQHVDDNDRRGDQTKSPPKRPRPLGIDAILDRPFEHRPRQPSFRRRPYAFGTPDEKRALQAMQPHRRHPPRGIE